MTTQPDPKTQGLQFPDILLYQGYSAPSRVEADVRDLEVIGEIPQALNGAYYRNCADACYPPLLGTDIFLNGDGMVHQVRFENGHADLKTRYVRTTKYKLETAARRALFGAYRNSFTDLPEVAGQDNNTANTSVMWHHGKLYALKESGRPYEMDPATLETIGETDFDGKLQRTFTAHPKIDPETGECLAIAYNAPGHACNTIELYVISPEGKITWNESFEAPYCSAVHDFLITRNHFVIGFGPLVCDWDRVKKGEPYWHWDSSKKSYVAIIPRREGVKKIRWFNAPRTVTFGHTFNAWDEQTPQGDVVHANCCIMESGWISQFPDINDPDAKELPPFPERWTFDLCNPEDTISIKRLAPLPGEMPIFDPRFATRKTQHAWFGTINPALGPMLEWGPKGPPFTCVAHLNEANGKLNFWYAGPDSAPEEPIFVPRAGAPEGEGWILTIVGRRAENRTDLVILDAQNIAAGPVATVKMPFRIHEGFHGIWVGEKELGWA